MTLIDWKSLTGTDWFLPFDEPADKCSFFVLTMRNWDHGYESWKWASCESGSSFRDAGWGAQSGERAGEMMSPGWLLNASVLQELEETAGNTRYMFKFLNSSSLHLIEFNPTFLIATSSPRVFSIVRIFLLLYYSTAENLYHRWAMALNTEKQNRIKVMSSSFVFRPISKIQTYSAQSAVMS